MRAARRKTLSGVDASQLNTRVHVGGTSNGEDTVKRTTSVGDAATLKRMAMASRVQSRSVQGKPSNFQRRHSLHFSSGQTPRVDPRPLGDKAYLTSCIRQLISFLSSRGFESALSPKTLSAPTAKEFAALSLFLFRQADENFKFGSKTEDDVPTVFKQLRYPFQISKNALYAVGSPHTWPSLLTALTWLVQIFIYEEEANRNEAKVERVEPAVSFFKYVSSAYRHFLAGDDAKCEQLENDFSSVRSEKNLQRTTNMRTLDQENSELETLLTSLSREPPRKTALQNEKDRLLKEMQKFEEDMNGFRSFVQASDAHLSQTRQNTRVHEEHFEECHEEVNSLRQQVSSQPVDAAGAKFTDKEIQKHRDALSAIKSQQEDVESNVCATEVESEQALADLETVVKAYNAVARQLQLIPQSAKYSNSISFEADINPRSQAGEELVNIDLESVRGAVKNIHEVHTQQKWSSEREYASLEQNLHTCQESLDETRDEADGLSLKVTRCETSYDSERKRLENVLSKIAKDLANIENDVAAVRQTSESNVSETETALHSCQGEYDACVKLCGEERLAVQNVMLAALDALMGHKQQVQDALDASNSNAKLIEVGSV